jgi:hypothetical protein
MTFLVCKNTKIDIFFLECETFFPDPIRIEPIFIWIPANFLCSKGAFVQFG